MLGSLRFRLTALFLMAVLVFGLVSIALAVRLFQDVTRSQSTRELEREAEGLAALYAESAIQIERRGNEGAGVRGEDAGARDRRPALLHRAVASSRASASAWSGCAGARSETSGSSATGS